MGGAGEMEDGTGWGREWGENGEGMDVPEMEIRENFNSVKTQQSWHLGTLLGSYFPGQHFFCR